MIALIGYDFIHRVERGLTYTFLVIFGVFTIGAIATLHLPAGALDPGKFDAVPFLTQFGVTAGTRSPGRSTSRTTRATCRRT